MKFNLRQHLPLQLKDKLWFDLFLKVGAIFVAFVLILTICNGTMLVDFFSFKQKKLLVSQLNKVSTLNIQDSSAVTQTLSEISDKYNFEVEIYTDIGKILYTTHGSQMMDYFTTGRENFSMSHEELVPIKAEKLKNGIIFATAVRRFDKSEFLICYKQLQTNVFAEIRLQKELITSSASIANEFISLVAVVCFILSLVWVLIFARKFSQPITKMNDITRNMAQLQFDRRLELSRRDEIGQLARSINEMSDSLSTALDDLKKSNARLRDEIELERQLDVMRRGFVANVSHELKTPLAIISGYAEGLKLNINTQSKEQYCNTIMDECNRMNRLVISILELSKYESGQISVNKQVFSLSEMAEEMVRRIFSGTAITATNQIAPETMIFADPLQIEQVLKSYLENAKAHTPVGGKVTISCTAAQNSGLRITVFNTGSSVSEEMMPQIWQSFFRGDASHKRENSRFGLGLSIVSAIMKMHGRSCGVYNTEDGVCFWFEADVPPARLPDTSESADTN